MAIEPTYGTVYYAPWTSPTTVGCLYIDLVGYLGEMSLLRMPANSLEITYNFQDWNSPIIPLQATFEILNLEENFYTLLPLLSAEERQYKVRIVVTQPTAQTLFEGFLNCDTITQRMQYRQSIKLAASNYILKLENDHPLSIDTIQDVVLINVIDEILISTGSFFPIRVNCKLHSEGDILGTYDTLFNKNGFYTELFWTDNLERKSSLEILKAILISVDCYLYWYDGCWYIERYEDLWNTEKEFVEYEHGVEHWPDTPGEDLIAVESEIINITDLQFTGQSQVMNLIPGLKTIKIELDDQRLLNLVKGDLTNISDYEGTDPEPDLRTWLYSVDSRVSWDDFGKQHNTILNSVKRVLADPVDCLPPELGICTAFRLTVDETSQLTINFKFGITFMLEREAYDFHFSYYLRDADTGYFITELENVWNLMDQISERLGTQTVMLNGSSFDKTSWVADVSISIPIGEVNTFTNGLPSGPLRGDKRFILMIGSEQVVPTGEDINDMADWYAPDILQPEVAWIGDINIQSTGANQPNVIEGKINAGFLNKKDISLSLYDAESFDYKNGILYGPSLQYRTKRWGTAGGSDNAVARGVCWNTTGSPTLDDNYTEEGSGFGEFTSTLTGLEINTQYFVRAYVTNPDETIYGNEETFYTPSLEVGSFYQGGYIFYILQPGDTGYDPDTTHGIIVAPTEAQVRDWWGALSGLTNYSPSAYGWMIGDAETNTGLIAESEQAPYGYQQIYNYGTPEYPPASGLWFWPTIKELMILRAANMTFLGMVNNWYWSSTEPSYSMKDDYDWDVGSSIPTGDDEWKFAFALNFGDTSNPDTWRKNNLMNIRAIKYF